MKPAQDIARGIVEGYTGSADAFLLLVAEIAKAIEATREECAVICDEEANTPDGDAASMAAERIRVGGGT